MAAKEQKTVEEEEESVDGESIVKNIKNDATLKRRDLLKTSALAAVSTGGATSMVSVGAAAESDQQFKNPDKVMIRQGYNNGGQLNALRLGNATFDVKWNNLMVGDIIDLDLKLRKLQTQTRFLPDVLFEDNGDFYESNFVPTDANRLLTVYNDDGDQIYDPDAGTNGEFVNINTDQSDAISSESDINNDSGAKMEFVEQPTDWETIGQTSIRVDQRTREDDPKKVDGTSFYLNSNYVDLANHSQVDIEDLDVDLSFTDEDLREHSIEGKQNEWKRGVLFQLKIDVTPPDQSTFTSQRYFLHTTVKAQLGTGIQFGNAFGVTEKRPDDLGSGTTESEVKNDDDLFLCDDLNFGGDDGEVSPDV